MCLLWLGFFGMLVNCSSISAGCVVAGGLAAKENVYLVSSMSRLAVFGIHCYGNASVILINTAIFVLCSV